MAGRETVRMMLRARVHGRGGQGTKTCGSIISLAGSLEGYYAQDSPMYGPERRGAPVASFVRISTAPLSERGYISSPEAVVLLDRSLLGSEQAEALRGLKRSGALIVNGTSEDGWPSVVAVDASSLALRTLGRNSISAAMAAVACSALGISSLGNLVEAVRTELNEIGLAEDEVEKNVALARECYAIPRKLELALETDASGAEEALVQVGYKPPEVSTAQILLTGNSGLQRTGLWRTSRPVIDYAKCTKCMVCYVYCPDSSITLEADLTPRIDYDNCKGCMICLTECPPRAIAEEAAP